ncbi:nucleoside/nucleotide kinase family protein [Mediterraneibacter agrestimuris]|uniref:guanylate kinase n=1 Tax=Mediterraneibacter agrestimuris TaxID=2941333 RepID=UPI00203C86B5|nr:guanylate kinase [Mediterraneibacter agrestimuris]
MGKIFYVMGKSSSGKDSIFKEIKKRMPELKDIVLYTTRPIREGETDGLEYHFVGEDTLREMEARGCVIEQRTYHTKCGIWRYFTASDGQVDLETKNYLVIGTLESYEAMKLYFGEEAVVPLYVEVEDGLRLFRALERERQQAEPKYAEMCRRFLADLEDFSEENLEKASIKKRFTNVEFAACVQEIMDYMLQFC